MTSVLAVLELELTDLNHHSKDCFRQDLSMDIKVRKSDKEWDKYKILKYLPTDGLLGIRRK